MTEKILRSSCRVNTSKFGVEHVYYEAEEVYNEEVINVQTAPPRLLQRLRK